MAATAWLDALRETVGSDRFAAVIRVAAAVLVGFPLLYLVSRRVRSALANHASAQGAFLAGKLVFYAGTALLIVLILRELGFGWGPLLGAAGVLGIALGFASQTSVSNLISGLFLIAEKPFAVDDVIAVGDTRGQVLSIDLLSVKLRTFDNNLVRIPNETLIKQTVTNITHFPIRRADLPIGVAYKEDLGKVREVLLDIARGNPLCLDEPAPMVILSGFGNSSIDILFTVWAQKADWLRLKNGIFEEVKRRFDEAGIEIPFPHLSLYSGEASKPFPVRIVGEPASDS